MKLFLLSSRERGLQKFRLTNLGKWHLKDYHQAKFAVANMLTESFMNQDNLYQTQLIHLETDLFLFRHL